ncbi:tripartite tricarboxylate transporter substrate binding protein [Burkholderiaceae bacterium FT117]|uniref:Bug family tripartite tricarboxylate transporter substrate binding protein n=1 Tax=Zeimonas sediminis TaxID=2944268 RepID=UPI002342CB3E|nr:tripartite tricarboxylate transporter substrate binding protein [Zeimonas sediminis]MCM5570455.1 tripartite tricarboxylate transporter substrate binding protein [Zeimonas sediminis]
MKRPISPRRSRARPDLSRRSLLVAGAAGLSGLPSAWAAGQPDFPSKPVNVIVPFTPGGGADIDVRLLTPGMGKSLGQPIVVENVSGAGGTIGVHKGTRAPADGHTLFYGSPSETVLMPMIKPELPYRTEDLLAVALSGFTPLAFFTRPDHPARDMDQLVDYAGRNPGKVTFGTSGIGSFQHLATELVKSRTGTFMLHIPYRGGAGVVADVMGGQLDFGVVVVPVVAGLSAQGRVKVLGVSSPERSAVVPNAPAFGESKALAGLDLQTWGMFFAPKGVPEPALRRLNAAIAAAAQAPAVIEQRRKMGTVAARPMDPEQAQAFLLAQRDLYRPVVGRIKFE